MKRFLTPILIMLLAAMASGCGIQKVQDVKITSVDFKYITPTSSRSLDAVLLIGIDNPAPTFGIQDLKGVIKYGGKEIAHYSAPGVEVKAKSTDVYEFPCSATLADGVSLLSILPILASYEPSSLTTDMDFEFVYRKGLHKKMSYKDLQIANLAQ